MIFPHTRETFSYKVFLLKCIIVQVFLFLASPRCETRGSFLVGYPPSPIFRGKSKVAFCQNVKTGPARIAQTYARAATEGSTRTSRACGNAG